MYEKIKYMEFAHLHVHTDYSLLDGACIINNKNPNKVDLIKLAKKFNMKSIAITDHGVMGGAIEFYKQLKKNNLNPIIGCEMYISPTTYDDKNPDVENIKGYHLILLSKNFTGYQNLCKLNSIAHLKGFYYKPRIDKKILSEHSEGLIGLSACLLGEIPYLIQKNDIKKTEKIISEYRDIFGNEDFYLEIMDHGIDKQKLVNKEIIKLSKKMNTPIVATNDVHYLERKHAKSHELMLCVQTNTIIPPEERDYFVKNECNNYYDDKKYYKDGFLSSYKEKSDLKNKRLRLETNEFYFKNGNEMFEIFKEYPIAIKNTIEISEKCKIEIHFAPEVNHYPIYSNTTDDNQKKIFLSDECMKNIDLKYKNPKGQKKSEIVNRINHEIEIIHNLKYSNYFLVVWDLIKHAKKNNIPVGPGRGSGAGSIVAYLLDISNIDPLQYNLIFERFLNPERVSPPDFDIDFCEKRRSEIIQYVKSKYGESNVAQIGTYGTLKPKSLIKDIGKALGITFEDRNNITKLMDDFTSISETIKNNENIKNIIKNNTIIRKIFELSEILEGINRHFSTHASGIIISNQKLSNLIPLAKGSNNEIITQYTSIACESLGLLKMDFLGLKTLTIIKNAIDLINIKEKSIIIENESTIPLNDKNTYNMINKGKTIGAFQLESDGMRDLCTKFNVKKIEDIIALIAIYRPGPMQFIPDFLERKNNIKMVEYDHPKIKNILKETYGIMLYQEQIIQIVQTLAGFSLSTADILRRAIGKKKTEELESQKRKFIDGCIKISKIDEHKANEIWNKIKLFTGYGFNKSHSTAYAILAYRTAYLKANYPVEFMAAILNSSVDKVEDIEFFIKECNKMKIKILIPDINISKVIFTVDQNNIRFGLSAIKGLGIKVVESIINDREKNGNYKDIIDFSDRIGYKLNAKNWDSIINSGTLDTIKKIDDKEITRSQILEILQKLIDKSKDKLYKNVSNQGFFNLIEDSIINNDKIKIPDIPEFSKQVILNNEKNLLGFYISGHPWNNVSNENKKQITQTLKELTNLKLEQNETRDIKTGGILTNIKYIKINKNSENKIIKFNIEDNEYNSLPCIVSPVKLKDSTILKKNYPIFISGIFRNNGRENEISVNEFLLDESVK